MSAVGLLLLEDPKARARAEARIRNGTAKRRSFFGRSGGGPASAASRKPNLPPTIPDEDGEEDSPIVRPSTSLSQTISLPHRKKGGSASDRSSSRNSMLGRKNSLGESIRSGSSGRASQLSGAVSTTSREPTRREEEHIQQVRKPATVPPTQVQQINHFAKKPLPQRPPVDEKDLQARYWAGSTFEKPKVKVNGAQTEDWATEQPGTDSDREPTAARPPSPIDPNPPRLPAAARMSFFDDTIFDEVKEPPFKPEDGGRALQQHRHAVRDQKHATRMLARNSLMFPEEPILPTPDAASGDNRQVFSDLNQNSVSVENSEVSSESQNSKATIADHGTVSASTPRDRNSSSTQISVPAPEQKPTARSSGSSLDSVKKDSKSSTQLDLPVEETIAGDPINSSRSSTSNCKSPLFSSNVRESTVFADSAWEDDIDFAYEQEADATCDFDWDHTRRNPVNSFHSEGGVRLSQSSYNTRGSSVYSQDTCKSNRDSRALHDDTRDSRILNNGSTAAGQNGVENARGFSVGHRGFAAARNSNGDKVAKAGKLPALNIPARSSQGEPLSPVGSITDSTDSDDDTPRSPLSPSNLDFPMPPGSSDALKFPLPPGAVDLLDFPVPPSAKRTSDSTSSDRDSWRNSSKHRKSSSYGSYEDYKRASLAPSTAPSSVNSLRDTGRWSMASASSVPSVPSLIHSGHKRASSLSKSVVSPTLATFTEEENSSDSEGAFVSQNLRLDPERGSFVIRRPRTSGDRRLLQAAGRAVQRYRPTTPNSNSRGVQGFDACGDRMQSTMTAPEWI